MTIQLHELFYGDVGNIIITHLHFDDVLRMRIVSKELHNGQFSEAVTTLLLEKGGIQNLYITEKVCSHIATFAQFVQRIFEEIFKKKISLKLQNITASFKCVSVIKRLLPEAEILEVELENIEIVSQLLQSLKKLKKATINLLGSNIKMIEHHSTLEELTLNAPNLHYAPNLYNFPELRTVTIAGCKLQEPPQVINCPKVCDLNYRTVPHHQSGSLAMDY
jgi:hypothetical protein